MAFYFVNPTTSEIIDYFTLKSLPDFNDPNDTPGWPADGFQSGLDGIINPYGWYRLKDTTKPTPTQLYKIVEKNDPEYILSGDYYEWDWVERDMTQPELDDLNAFRKSENDFARALRYSSEADPIFFKAQRGETTEQAWLDKIAEIRSDLPDPAIVTLP